ncbi:hypothetical protein [Mesorhizobium sp. DCY119]|uniref:hypothetical protein n=1 Tax=Mesorhizobium sp. DCY119 TaxID=2108445 RepID=UPI0010585C56|nr:hypothetical protein [Mesorhizobium sp. DCY119]
MSFQALSTCIGRLSASIRENSTDATERAKAVRAVQVSEFDEWYFDFNALCESRSDDVFSLLNDEAIELVDGILEVINMSSEDASAQQLTELNRNLSRIKQNFLSRAKAHIQSARLGLK